MSPSWMRSSKLKASCGAKKWKQLLRLKQLWTYFFEGAKALFLGYTIFSIYYFGSAALGGCFVFLFSSGFYFGGIVAVLNWLLDI
jgi:hypothetical protein